MSTDNPTEKATGNTSTADAKATTPDLQVFGNPDVWQLVCKASSQKQGWLKSTKVMNLPNGCLVQVSMQQGEHVSEALQWVPGIHFSEGRFAKIATP